MSNGCNFHCLDGKVQVGGVWQDCPDCKGKRSREIKGEVCEDGKPIWERLNVVYGLAGTAFESGMIFGGCAGKITEQSMIKVGGVLERLAEKALIGEFPKEKILLSLGSMNDEQKFLYPYVLRLYERGLDIKPVVVSRDLRRLRMETIKDFNGADYDDYLKCRVCIIIITEGCYAEEWRVVKEVMEERVKRGRGTLVFTRCPLNVMQEWGTLGGGVYVYNVEYAGCNMTAKKEASGEGIPEMSGAEFDKFFRTENIH